MDNESKKWNQIITDDIIVLSPCILHERPRKVIIASAYANEIVMQLNEFSVTDFQIFPSLQLSNEAYYTDIELIGRLFVSIKRLESLRYRVWISQNTIRIIFS